MSGQPPSLLARALEPLVAGLWILFLIWTALVAGVWLTSFGEIELGERIANPGLRGALRLFLAGLDVTWFGLASALGYQVLAQSNGITTARRWAVMIVLATLTVATASALTDWPLGPIRYTDRFGSKIGPVALGVPFVWFILITGARATVLLTFPRLSHAAVSGLTGLLAGTVNAACEPIAWKMRAWWLWYPGNVSAPPYPPLHGLLVWTLLAGVCAFFMRESQVTAPDRVSTTRLRSIYLIISTVILVTTLRWILRW